MSLDKIDAGADSPREVNVVVEIPLRGEPVKYEVDKATGAVFVDRFLNTAMYYPCNYGYVPRTVSNDGDPVDVLVVTPVPLIPGAVVRCRPVGLLDMTDESGEDAKVLAVPIGKLCPLYQEIRSHEDLPVALLDQIRHFFEHYKDLEPGKWVKMSGWKDTAAAEREIMSGVERYRARHPVRDDRP
jgi:inorganic pyrophosphatase